MRGTVRRRLAVVVTVWSIAVFTRGAQPGVGDVTASVAMPRVGRLVGFDPTRADVLYGVQTPRPFVELGQMLVESRDGGISWFKLGTLPKFSGHTVVVVPERGGTTTFYLLDRGKLMRSQDRGASWQSFDAELFKGCGPAFPGTLFPDSDVAGLAVTEGTPRVLWAATGHGLYHKADGEQVWTCVLLPGDEYVPLPAVSIDPHDPALMLAASHDGIMRSTNGGRSWQRVTAGLEGFSGGEADLDAEELVFHPTDRRTVFAAGADVLVSQDRGESWRPFLRANYDGYCPGMIAGADRIDHLVIDPRRPSVMYATYQGCGVWRTTDGGKSWSMHSHGLLGLDQFSLLLDPRRPGTLYASTDSGVHVSRDGAVTWRPTSLAEVSVRTVVWGPRGTIFAGTDFGVFVSNNCGKRWSRYSSNLAQDPVTSLAVDPVKPGYTYVGLRDRGQDRNALFVSHDDGKSWSRHSFRDRRISCVRALGGRVVLTGLLGGLFRSTDDGENWAEVQDPRLPESDAADFNWFAASARAPDRVWAAEGGLGVVFSSNGGLSWENIGSGITPSRGFLGVRVVLPHPIDRMLAIAATYAGLQRTTDGGRHWQVVEDKKVQPTLYLAVDPTPPYTLYAANGEKVFRSVDRGATWEEAGTMVESSILCLATDPDGGLLCAGTTSGFAVSRDGGSSWHWENSGLTDQVIGGGGDTPQ